MKTWFIYSNIYPTRCNVTQFILSGNCSTCFGWYHHPSSGAQTTASTDLIFVRPLLLPTAIASDEMQRYTVYFIWKLLYMFRMVPSPIIRSTNNCIYRSDICRTVTATCRYSIQRGATLHSSFYLETALHVSDGTITHHQERKQLYLQIWYLSDCYCYLPL